MSAARGRRSRRAADEQLPSPPRGRRAIGAVGPQTCALAGRDERTVQPRGARAECIEERCAVSIDVAAQGARGGYVGAQQPEGARMRQRRLVETDGLETVHALIS
jgi:hypothetical protein